MLKVYNVGQGDSFLLRPNNNCLFDKAPLLVDCGPSKANVASRIPRNDVAILITHSHNDHIGGLTKVINTKNVRAIWIPYFLPEIIQFIKHLNKKSLNKYHALNWMKLAGTKILLVGEGDKLCKNHTEVFNPQKDPYSFFSGFAAETSLQSAVEGLNAIGFEISQEFIEEYETPMLQISQDIPENYAGQAKLFVKLFTTSLFLHLNEKTDETIRHHLVEHVESIANAASIVFRYNHDSSESILFTGDAELPVFERLIKKKSNISTTILKSPHHGSSHNIDIPTLQAINPDCAIISHNNGRFGTGTESHPHSLTIKHLARLGIPAYYTNDVVKAGVPTIFASRGLVYKNLLDFC